MPWDAALTWPSFNYTPLMVGGAFLLFGGWYLISARKWFKGPVRQGSDEELAAIERTFGEAARPLRRQPP